MFGGRDFGRMDFQWPESDSALFARSNSALPTMSANLRSLDLHYKFSVHDMAKCKRTPDQSQEGPVLTSPCALIISSPLRGRLSTRRLECSCGLLCSFSKKKKKALASRELLLMMTRPGMQPAFYSVPDVYSGVEVRALRRSSSSPA